MFNWYSRAQACYAYLSDVDGLGDDDPSQPSSSFRKSRWFQRGWTLQELLAPLEVVFLNRDWVEIGTKTTLASVISSITRIAPRALDRPLCGSETAPHPCRGHSVAEKLSWAAFRKTTREEDRAYSLLGLFGVNMPLLYGEGGEKAFARLQQEIMKQSSDDSIFAWSPNMWGYRETLFPLLDLHRSGLTAWRPGLFSVGFCIYTASTAEAFASMESSKWTPATLAHSSTAYEETQHFLSLNAPVLTSANLPKISKTRIFTLEPWTGSVPGTDVVYNECTAAPGESILSGKRVIAILSCCFVFGRVGIVLEEGEDGTYSRVQAQDPVGVQVTELPQREVLMIRQREVAGDPCGLRPTSSGWEITSLEVVLLERGGYSTTGRCCENLDWIGEIGMWQTTEKGEKIRVDALSSEWRVALLYRHEGGDSVSNHNFVLAFHRSFETGFRFVGVAVDDNDLTGEGWVKTLSGAWEWREPGATQLSLGETRVEVSMRKARRGFGQRWYIFLSFQQA
jgi:hypothetical protein